MKKAIYILLLIMVLTGCKTRKNTYKSDVQKIENKDLATKAESTSKIDVETSTLENSEAVVSSRTTDNGTVSETTEEHSITIYYSNPDNAGKQYPISLNTTTRTTISDEIKNVQTTTDSKTGFNSESYFVDHSQIKSLSTEEDKGQTALTENTNLTTKTKTKTPTWVYIAGLILFVVFGICIYRILKRHKIIK